MTGAGAGTVIGLGRGSRDVRRTVRGIEATSVKHLSLSSTAFHLAQTDNAYLEHQQSDDSGRPPQSATFTVSLQSSSDPSLVKTQSYIDTRISELIKKVKNDPERFTDNFRWLLRFSIEIGKIRNINKNGNNQRFLMSNELYLCEQIAELYASGLDEFIKYCQEMISQYQGKNISNGTSKVLEQSDLIFKNATLKSRYQLKLETLLHSFIEHEFEYAYFVLQFITTAWCDSNCGIMRSLRRSVDTLSWKLENGKASYSILTLMCDNQLTKYQKRYKQLVCAAKCGNRDKLTIQPNPKAQLTSNTIEAIKKKQFDKLEQLCWTEEKNNPFLKSMLEEQLGFQLDEFYKQREKSRSFQQSFSLLKSQKNSRNSTNNPCQYSPSPATRTYVK